MANVTAEFEKEKETKNKVRYAEQGDDPKIGTLYLDKAVAKELDDPDKLFVTVEAR